VTNRTPSQVIDVTAIKVWYWIDMARIALARDLRRVELQVALLSKRIDATHDR